MNFIRSDPINLQMSDTHFEGCCHQICKITKYKYLLLYSLYQLLKCIKVSGIDFERQQITIFVDQVI